MDDRRRNLEIIERITEEDYYLLKYFGERGDINWCEAEKVAYLGTDQEVIEYFNLNEEEAKQWLESKRKKREYE